MNARPSLAERVARLARAMERAASDAASESRQTALEGLVGLERELAAYFAAEDALRAPSPQRRAARARLRGDLAALDERARAAGDWPESWRPVSTAFSRFARALDEHERSEAPAPPRS